MSKLRVAVIGVGYLGKAHARVYHSLPDAELVAVVDTDEARAKALGQEYGAAAYTDYHQVLDKIDAASIVVPTQFHHQVAKEFLERGIPVLVEKPMTRTLQEADELVNLSRKHSTALQVGHIERFNPAILAIDPHLNNPRYISTDRISPYSFRSVDIGVVMDLMIHDLDIVLHLVKSEVAEVHAIGLPVLSKHEDMANARIVFKNNCVANLTASRVNPKKLRMIRIFQPDAYISLDYEAKKGRMYKRAPGFTPEMASPDKIKVDAGRNLLDIVFKDFIQITDLEMTEQEPLKLELESFVKAVQTRTDPVVPGEHGRRAIAAAMMILSSIQKNSSGLAGL